MTGPPPSGLSVRPLPSGAEVGPGDDLAGLVLAAVADVGETLVDGDVVAVASKVVAKAEGAVVALPAAEDVHAARRRLARARARRVVADAPWVLIVETHHGLVCANAGIDTSNLPGDDTALLLPEDPDRSAAALREALRRRSGAAVGVVVTDTFGRPWRLGQTDVAVGAAGVEVLRDDRGTRDREGRELGVSIAAVGDALAAAADLVRRKHDGTPFVLLRGLDVAGDGTAADLRRPSAEDLFRTGGRTTAITSLLDGAAAARDRSEVAAAPPPPAFLTDLDRAVAALAPTVTLEATGEGVVLRGGPADSAVARTAALVVAAAHGLVAHTSPVDGGVAVAVGRERR